jgi:hypothetical protein
VLGIGLTCVIDADMASPFVSKIRFATSAAMPLSRSASSSEAAGRSCGSGVVSMPHMICRRTMGGIA